jgi:hypothetical protein
MLSCTPVATAFIAVDIAFCVLSLDAIDSCIRLCAAVAESHWGVGSIAKSLLRVLQGSCSLRG